MAGCVCSDIEKHIVKHGPSHLVFEIIDSRFPGPGWETERERERRGKRWSCNFLEQNHLLPKNLCIVMQSQEEGHTHWQRTHPPVLLQSGQAQSCSLAMPSLLQEIWSVWTSYADLFSASLPSSWQNHPPCPQGENTHTHNIHAHPFSLRQPTFSSG